MAKIPFTDNYVDLSSNRGFQFKFHCQKCGNGYVSTFQPNALSTVSTAPERCSRWPRAASRAWGMPSCWTLTERPWRRGRRCPEHWASFLLVPVGQGVVLEILAGPSAATYVFEGNIGEINRDLQQLHFRRAQLALSEAQAAITPDNPHRLALRKLAPLQQLRAATRARVTHTGEWSGAVRAAVESL